MTRSLLRFTDKAVERYVSWFEPDLSHEQARIDLETAALDATKVGQRSINGDADLWELPALDVQIVVRAAKDDPQGAGTVVGLVPPWAMDRQREHLERATMQAEEALAAAGERAAAAKQRNTETKIAVAAAQSRCIDDKSQAARYDQEAARAASKWAYLDAQVELAVLSEVCKTARMRMAVDDEYRQIRAALRIAVRAIQAYDYTDPLTIQREREAALAEISQTFPDATTEDFLCQRRKRT